MAKIRIHELAKELKKENKEIIAFLQEKGVEGKTASSGLDAQEEQLVRNAFDQKAAVKPEVKAEAKPEVKPEVKPEAKPEGKPEVKPENRVDAKQPEAAAAAPKKKKIIIVSSQTTANKPQVRPQNGGNAYSGNSQQGRGQNNGYNNNNNRPVNNNVRPQQTVRTPIKPLTPPSPTPSVQMVPNNQQVKKVNPVEKKGTEANEAVKPAETQNVNAQTAPVQESAPVAEKTNAQAQNVPAQETTPAVESKQANPAAEAATQQVNTGDANNRQNNTFVRRDGAGQGNRDNRQGGQYGNRDGQGSYNRDGQGGYNRQGGQGSYNRDGQGQGGYNRQGGQGGYNRDGQGGYNRQGGQGGYNRDGQGGYNRQGGQGGYNRDGQGGYNRQGGQGGYNKDSQGGYNKDGQGRTGQYQGGSRDGGRGGFGGQGGRPGQGGQFGGRDGRDSRAGKNSFASEAPAKDMEKKREEDKRRFSQEKDKRNKKDYMYEEDEAAKGSKNRLIKPEKKKEEVVEEEIKVIVLPDTITIKDLATKMRQQPAALIKKLFLEGKIVTLNQEISFEEAEALAMEYEILCEREVKVDVIEELLKEEEENEEDLKERPPVICVMGHVDHGKTSLLDAIRKTNVTDKEAGGITQHIGAYTVTLDGRNITFLDTPGHEAFTAMRMRGANSTDIAVLVVAADDGVMPQTIEAINHAKAAGIEIVVAVNKIDKPSANIERVKQELTEYELVATDWGGNTEFVPVSAKTGQGIEDLLETILLTADIMELKANPNRRARGLVIEAELDKGRGPVATVLVQKGTLHVGDFISAGASHGKVRAMVDDKGRRVREAGPSTPVEILGLNDVPSAGEVFLAHDSDKTAKSFAETYMAQNKEKMLEETKGKMSLDDLFSQIKEGNLKELNLIVKADVQGSVEAVKQSLLKLSNEEVVVKCIHGGVGAINESDVVLASASNAIIIGFNVRPDAMAKSTAEREGVDVRLYKVIYQAIEDVEAAMKGMLDPVYEEKIIGHAEVRQIFRAASIGNIAGSYVKDGIFQKDCLIRIRREGEQIYEGKLASLKRFKDDVKEVKTGFECGLVFDGFDQIQELDEVEAYIMVEVPR